MAQGPDAPSGYDWGNGDVPAGPEPLVPPDRRVEDAPYGAPSFTYDTQDAAAQPSPGRWRGVLPAWAIVVIVAVQATAMVASVALVLGGIGRLRAPEPAAPVAAPSTEAASPTAEPEQASPEETPGTVTDPTGREVADGAGGYDRPATLEEHALGWTVWTGGTLTVTALEVDLAATAPGARGEDVIQEGYRLVLATYEVAYEGPGALAPAEELWLSGETDRTYFPDVGEGLVPDPMTGIGPLGNGESARFRSAFLVPESEIGSLRLGVETAGGQTLYVATS